MSNLINLILYLEDKNYTLSYISIDDIIVVNKKNYFFMNSTNVVQIVNNFISINYPIKTNDFLSPELKNIKTIPYKTYYTSCYYSLACVVFFSLFNLNYTANTEELKKIYYTKLYFFLLRCLNVDPMKRKLIFI